MGERADLEAEIEEQRASRAYNQELAREEAACGDRPGMLRGARAAAMCTVTIVTMLAMLQAIK